MAAIDSGLGAAQAAQVAEMNRATALMRRKNDLDERRLQASERRQSGGTVSDFVLGTESTIQKEWSEGAAALKTELGAPRAGAMLPAGIQRERASEAAQAVEAADAESKREAAEASKEVRRSFVSVAAAAVAVAAGLNAMNDARKAESMKLSEQRIARGEGLRRLGQGADVQAEANRLAEGEEGPGGGMTVSQDALFWQAAGDAYMTPELGKTQYQRLKKLQQDASVPFDVKMKIARQGQEGIVTQNMAGIGLGSKGSEITAAQMAQAINEGIPANAGRDIYKEGVEIAEYDARTQARTARGGAVSQALGAAGAIPVVGPIIQQSVNRPISAIESFGDLDSNYKGAFGQQRLLGGPISNEDIELTREAIKLARERNRLAREAANKPVSTTAGLP